MTIYQFLIELCAVAAWPIAIIVVMLIIKREMDK